MALPPSYPIYYGDTVFAMVGNSSWVSGYGLQKGCSSASTKNYSPMLSSQVGPDTLQILGPTGNIPVNSQGLPLPVTYGAQVSFYDITTSQPWQVYKTCVYSSTPGGASPNGYSTGVFTLNPVYSTPIGSPLSAFEFGIIGFGGTEANAVYLSTSSTSFVSGTETTGLLLSKNKTQIEFFLGPSAPNPLNPVPIPVNPIPVPYNPIPVPVNPVPVPVNPLPTPLGPPFTPTTPLGPPFTPLPVPVGPPFTPSPGPSPGPSPVNPPSSSSSSKWRWIGLAMSLIGLFLFSLSLFTKEKWLLAFSIPMMLAGAVAIVL